MTLPTPANEAAPRRGWPPRFWPWLAVIIIILGAGLIRLRLLDIPLERDEGEYAYAGQLILQGIPPYELAYNMKLPGTYYAYAAGMAVFGQTIRGVHLTLLAANALTCVFVFLLGRKMGGVKSGLAACASYAAMSVSPAVLGQAAHATQFVLLFAVPGLWLLWRALDGGGNGEFLAGGLMLGLAFMMKQPGLCYGLFAAVMIVRQGLLQRRIFKREFQVSLFLFCGGVALPFAFFCVTALLAGDFGKFWFWAFDYASHYASRRSLAEGWDSLASTVREALPAYGGFGLLAALSVLALLPAKERRNGFIFLSVLGGFSFLGTAAGLNFRNHYFVLMLPACAWLIGLGMESMERCFKPGRMAWLPSTLLAAALAWSLAAERSILFELTPRQICVKLYHGNPFLESLPIAQYIHDNSPSTARVAVVGSEPQIYFYSGRHSATGYIYMYPLTEYQPYANSMQLEMIREVEAARPEFLVRVTHQLSLLKYPKSDQTVFNWAEDYAHQFYDPVAVAGFRPDGVPLLAYGQYVAEAAKSLPESMTLYQRKPDAGPTGNAN